MNGKSTSERLYERYHTAACRPSFQDPGSRRVMFAAFRRTLGPWLPGDRSARILDVACGEGAFLGFLRERGYTNLAGFDISPENVARCHAAGLPFVRQFDARRLSEWPEPEPFDAVFAMDLIEHLAKQSAASFLEQVRNRLRAGGTVVLQTPNMGSVVGCYQRYYDLSHEFGLTEKTAVHLMMLAGFEPERIEVRPAWNATTALGRLRELYLRVLHSLVFIAEGASRPRIPTRNLLIRACVR